MAGKIDRSGRPRKTAAAATGQTQIRTDLRTAEEPLQPLRLPTEFHRALAAIDPQSKEAFALAQGAVGKAQGRRWGEVERAREAWRALWGWGAARASDDSVFADPVWCGRVLRRMGEHNAMTPRLAVVAEGGATRWKGLCDAAGSTESPSGAVATWLLSLLETMSAEQIVRVRGSIAAPVESESLQFEKDKYLHRLLDPVESPDGRQPLGNGGAGGALPAINITQLIIHLAQQTRGLDAATRTTIEGELLQQLDAGAT